MVCGFRVEVVPSVALGMVLRLIRVVMMLLSIALLTALLVSGIVLILTLWKTVVACLLLRMVMALLMSLVAGELAVLSSRQGECLACSMMMGIRCVLWTSVEMTAASLVGMALCILLTGIPILLCAFLLWFLIGSPTR